jgi:REP element-mobilizing transposase RayT
MFRGLERGAIFRDDEDRLALVERLELILPETLTACLAWVFMSNHVHLALRTGSSPLSRVMARVLTAYAVHFNRRHDRVGHVFQNRFRSRLLNGHDDLMGVIRYIHRNPREARLLEREEDLALHPWCSYGALTGRRRPWSFESILETIELLGGRNEAARILRRWVSEEFDGTIPVSDPPLPERSHLVRARLHSALDFESVLAAGLRRFGLREAELRSARRDRRTSRARAAIAYESATRLGLTGAEIARRLGLSSSGVARAIARGRSAADPSSTAAPASDEGLPS